MLFLVVVVFVLLRWWGGEVLTYAIARLAGEGLCRTSVIAGCFGERVCCTSVFDVFLFAVVFRGHRQRVRHSGLHLNLI